MADPSPKLCDRYPGAQGSGFVVVILVRFLGFVFVYAYLSIPLRLLDPNSLGLAECKVHIRIPRLVGLLSFSLLGFFVF